MDPENAQHFSLNLASAVDKVYQRNVLSRQIFDALEVYCISPNFRKNNNNNKTYFEKKYQQTTKPWQITS